MMKQKDTTLVEAKRKQFEKSAALAQRRIQAMRWDKGPPYAYRQKPKTRGTRPLP